MKYIANFNIGGTNSDGPLIIHHVLSMVNPMNLYGISNMEINLGRMKLGYFENNVII